MRSADALRSASRPLGYCCGHTRRPRRFSDAGATGRRICANCSCRGPCFQARTVWDDNLQHVAVCHGFGAATPRPWLSRRRKRALRGRQSADSSPVAARRRKPREFAAASRPAWRAGLYPPGLYLVQVVPFRHVNPQGSGVLLKT